jgi:hypothetical protein
MFKKIKSKLNAEIPTGEQFLSSANGKRKTRIFDEHDYQHFVSCIRKARRMVNVQEPYYIDYDAGGVARAYFKKGLSASTSFYAVWVLGDTVFFSYGEVRLNSNGNSPCVLRQKCVKQL